MKAGRRATASFSPRTGRARWSRSTSTTRSSTSTRADARRFATRLVVLQATNEPAPAKTPRKRAAKKKAQLAPIFDPLPTRRSAFAGKTTVNVLPSGPLASSTSVPRWASAIHRAIGSPRPGPLPAPRGIELHEPIEDPRPIRGRNARALVADAQTRTSSAFAAEFHRDDRRRPAVLNGVLQDVQHEPAQQVLVAATRNIRRAAPDES